VARRNLEKSDGSLPVGRRREAPLLRDTSQPGADLARLSPQVDGTAWGDLEDEAKLSAFAVPSNPLLVDAIARRWQRNDRQWIGSKQRERANTDSPGLI